MTTLDVVSFFEKQHIFLIVSKLRMPDRSKNVQQQPLPCQMVSSVRDRGGRNAGAGGDTCWRKWGCLLAQVGMLAGAGGSKYWRRWRKKGRTCAIGERTDTICGAGPLPKNPPAPRLGLTCTKTRSHLRQNFGLPCSPSRSAPMIRLHLHPGLAGLDRMPLDDLTVAVEFETVGAVGERDAVETE